MSLSNTTLNHAKPCQARKPRFAKVICAEKSMRPKVITDDKEPKEKADKVAASYLDDTAQRLLDAGISNLLVLKKGEVTECHNSPLKNGTEFRCCNGGEEVIMRKSNELGNQKNPDRPIDKQYNRSVSFADSVGRDLESIRIMTEGRDTPPQLQHCFPSLGCEEKICEPSLCPRFEQPITNYCKFLGQLSKNCVSLESLNIKGDVMTGLVKVKNIAYRKLVEIRYTVDSWASSEVLSCDYLNPAHGVTKNSVYDTFRFQMDVDKSWENLEFCVCYTCQGETHWDNNDGANYRLWKEQT